MKIDYSYHWYTHGVWPFYNALKGYQINLNADGRKSYPGCKRSSKPKKTSKQGNDEFYQLNYVRKTMNMPNYWSLLGLETVGSTLFGVNAADYNVMRWETIDGDSPVSMFEKNVSKLKFRFNFSLENEVIIEYKSLNDILGSVGGIYISIVGFCLYFYDLFFG